MYYRRQPASFVEQFGRSFAACTEGSVLIMKHEGSERFLQFRKGPDPGGSEQEVVLGVPNIGPSKQYLDSVVAALDRARVDYELIERSQGDSHAVFLEARVFGEQYWVAAEMHRLVKYVLPTMHLSPDDRFTFHIEGGYDPYLDARVNEAGWRYAFATTESRILKWLAARQIKRASRKPQR